jgi:hypothetical protein
VCPALCSADWFNRINASSIPMHRMSAMPNRNAPSGMKSEKQNGPLSYATSHADMGEHTSSISAGMSE